MNQNTIGSGSSSISGRVINIVRVMEAIIFFTAVLAAVISILGFYSPIFMIYGVFYAFVQYFMVFFFLISLKPYACFDDNLCRNYGGRGFAIVGFLAVVNVGLAIIFFAYIIFRLVQAGGCAPDPACGVFLWQFIVTLSAIAGIVAINLLILILAFWMYRVIRDHCIDIISVCGDVKSMSFSEFKDTLDTANISISAYYNRNKDLKNNNFNHWDKLKRVKHKKKKK